MLEERYLRIHRMKTSFEQVERCSGTPPEIDETLERYYVVKLNSLQFCGPPNFNLPLWAGLEAALGEAE